MLLVGLVGLASPASSVGAGPVFHDVPAVWGAHGADVERLRQEAQRELDEFRAQKRAEYDQIVRSLGERYKAERAQLREAYVAEYAAWKARCVGVMSGDDPFFADDCSEERRALLDGVRTKLHILREEVQRLAQDASERLRREAEQFMNERMARLYRAIEDASAPDPFRDEPGWRAPPGPFAGGCARSCGHAPHPGAPLPPPTRPYDAPVAHAPRPGPVHDAAPVPAVQVPATVQVAVNASAPEAQEPSAPAESAAAS